MINGLYPIDVYYIQTQINETDFNDTWNWFSDFKLFTKN